jgi:hypothetical protein
VSQPSASISYLVCSLQSFSHTQKTHAQRKIAAPLCSSTSLGCRVWGEWICVPQSLDKLFFCARCSLDSGAPTHKAGTHTHTHTHPSSESLMRLRKNCLKRYRIDIVDNGAAAACVRIKQLQEQHPMLLPRRWLHTTTSHSTCVTQTHRHTMLVAAFSKTLPL